MLFRSVSESGDFAIETDAGPRFALARPFPNPWRGKGAATFPISVPSRGAITLELYDLQGKLVTRHPPIEFAGGRTYTIDWNPGPIPSGVYIVRAVSSSGESTHTKWVSLR